MGKSMNVKIHMKYLAYPINFRPHILLNKNIPFPILGDLRLSPGHVLFIEIFNFKNCVQSLPEN